MARRPREVIDDGHYHVIQRGNDRRRVFREDDDFGIYCSLLKKYLNKYTSHLYHYCLMSNHVHLLIKVIKAGDLSKLMQGIDLSYTHFYKKKYRFTGLLWQGRYKSIIIERDEYLMECARYIERNPLRANIVTDPCDYPYTSYNFYVQNRTSDIITLNPLCELIGLNNADRQTKYREYVLQDRPYEHIVDNALKVMGYI